MDDIFVRTLTGSLGALDIIVVGASIALLFAIAYLAGRKESDTSEYFVGRRSIPALVVCMSFVATEVSAVTIISVPATGYSENLQYLQFFIGSAAARIFVAFLFIPVFYKHNCTSIYEFLRDRFGPETQYTGSIFFFITRLLASGVRLYAACMAVSLIMGWSLIQTLLLITVISILMIGFGGIKAVVWAGAYEAIVFYIAGAAVLGYLFCHISGGIGEIWRVAGESGRLSLFKMNLNFADPTTFWAGSVNAFFVGLAIFGTDQELVQRLLTVQTRRKSQWAIISTIAAALPMLCIYIFIGTLLFVFYKQNPAIGSPAQPKEILSHFVTNVLPFGLKGLVLAAIVLASIDSPLSSLASSFVMDIYRPLINRNATEKHYLFVSRAAVVSFGVVLAAIAFACQPVQNILWFAFQIISVTGGPVLGIFLFGVLTKTPARRTNIVAMVVPAVLVAAILLLSKYYMEALAWSEGHLVIRAMLEGVHRTGVLSIGWSWLIVAGTLMTFASAWLLALAARPAAARQPR
jgi:solute:Na+ symporter, SSS family